MSEPFRHGPAPAGNPDGEGVAGLSIDHLAIAVADLEEASEPYRLLGLVREGADEQVASQHVRIRTFRAGPSLVELLEPTSDEGPVARFLQRRGPGLHHVAFRVFDLDGEMDRLKAAGARFLTPDAQPGRAGSRVVFLHPGWAGGVLVELVEAPGE